MRLTLIRGLPGSGKSTYARSLGVFHVEADMFRMRDGEYVFDPRESAYVYQECQVLVEEIIGSSVDCVISNRFLKAEEVEQYRELAEYYGADFKVIRMQGDFGSTHQIPEEALQKMKEEFEDYEGEVFKETK